MIEAKQPPLSYYVSRLESGAPFAFSRWGDGEFLAVLGYGGQNCDRHEYFPALGADLRRVLLNQHPYTFAIGPLATAYLGRKIERFLSEQKVAIEWHSTDIFVESLLAGQLQPLVDVLRGKRVHYVGPGHLFNRRRAGTVAGVFPWASASVIPDVNCYLSKARILDGIVDTVQRNPVDVIGFSAGMLSNVLIDELWPVVGQTTALVDFGSLWDGAAGKISRSYHRKVDYRVRERRG